MSSRKGFMMGLNVVFAVLSLLIIGLLFLLSVRYFGEHHVVEINARVDGLSQGMSVFPLLRGAINGVVVSDALSEGDYSVLSGFNCVLYVNGVNVNACREKPFNPIKADFVLVSGGQLSNYSLEVDV